MVLLWDGVKSMGMWYDWVQKVLGREARIISIVLIGPSQRWCKGHRWALLPRSRTEHITAPRAAEDLGERMEEVNGGSFCCDPVLCAYRDEEEAELPSETLPSLQVQQVCTVGMWWDVTQGSTVLHGCLGRGEQQHTGLLLPHFGREYLETEAGKLNIISNGYTLCQAFCFLFSFPPFATDEPRAAVGRDARQVELPGQRAQTQEHPPCVRVPGPKNCTHILHPPLAKNSFLFSVLSQCCAHPIFCSFQGLGKATSRHKHVTTAFCRRRSLPRISERGTVFWPRLFAKRDE